MVRLSRSFVIMEAPSIDGIHRSGPGRAISTPAAEDQVDEALSWLYADDRVWWKAEVSTNCEGKISRVLKGPSGPRSIPL